MPTYRSLTLSLVSQFDILNIPEFSPPEVGNDPFTTTGPQLVDPSTSVVSVYIPIYPSSQFWLSYSISPPYPPGLLYYFKLYINGSLITSWGVGEADGYRGKTMFGLYASREGRRVERRTLSFGPPPIRGEMLPGSLDNVMEVRVFRSKGRKRVLPEFEDYQETGAQCSLQGSKKMSQPYFGDGIDLVNAGMVPQEHPQRYYKYALLDPLDQPFSTFRYYYRTWDQLEALGVISPPPSVGSSSISTAEAEMERCSPPERSFEDRASLGDPDDADNNPVSASGGGDTGRHQSHLHLLSTLENAKDDTNTAAEPTTKLTTTETPPQLLLNRSPTPPPSSPSLTHNNHQATSQPSPAPLNPTSVARQPSQPTPPTTPAPSTTSKESFATLIRTHLPSPNPDSFKLTDLSATIEKTSSFSSASTGSSSSRGLLLSGLGGRGGGGGGSDGDGDGHDDDEDGGVERRGRKSKRKGEGRKWNLWEVI